MTHWQQSARLMLQTHASTTTASAAPAFALHKQEVGKRILKPELEAQVILTSFLNGTVH